ncbi:urea ABC transporter permease subunit UrtB [Amaricoccus macauensis]|uniref:urea ABC transporter permease subunit UrtB n=1 Tax=Amaricoccus macauensis TaxID=57001 RepID=UPI003C7D109F
MRFLVTLFVWLVVSVTTPAFSQTLEDLLPQLPEGDYDDRAEVIRAIAVTGDERALAVLRALGDRDLHVRESDGAILIVTGSRSNQVGTDPLTGADLGPVERRTTDAIRINNSLRRVIAAAIGTLNLTNPNPARRLSAANAAFDAPDPDQIEALETALEVEEDSEIRRALEQARARTLLETDAPTDIKVEAIDMVASKGGNAALAALGAYRNSDDPAIAEAAEEAIAGIERKRAMWAQAQNIWFGLSLGSVLLLAAVGLAITFGVMGVINMAHGELIMLGAYTTFMVQEVIRTSAPWLFDYSLLIATPAAFLVAGAVGVGIERGIVRHLYGRPLETLLATWGVSLILQQSVRTIFGPTNQEVGNPSWMSGAFQFGEMTVTWNRFYIIIFAIVVFVALLTLLRRTALGLQMRAVTQNRAMASEMGIPTGRVDALTFGLGAGIAGLAGVALSQIDNVSPNLGQTYIIDSFLVVVFGGAGNLWGTFAAAFSLGIANKFLEPYAGAVLGKILILVFIILFIQKRPRGLFPQRGRAVEG